MSCTDPCAIRTEHGDFYTAVFFHRMGVKKRANRIQGTPHLPNSHTRKLQLLSLQLFWLANQLGSSTLCSVIWAGALLPRRTACANCAANWQHLRWCQLGCELTTPVLTRGRYTICRWMCNACQSTQQEHWRRLLLFAHDGVSVLCRAAGCSSCNCCYCCSVWHRRSRRREPTLICDCTIIAT